MSMVAMTWAMKQKVGSPTKKLILMLLADRANESGLSWPSQAKLAEDAELSRESINRNIKQLEKDGFLKIIHRSKDGVSLPNYYQLQMRGVVTQDHRGSDAGSQGVVTEDHRGSDAGSHRTQREPKDRTQIEPTAHERVREDAPKKTDGNFSFNLNRKQPYSKLSEDYKKRLFGYAITKDGADQFQAFADFHTAKGTAFKDWASAYRTWLRNVTKFGGDLSSPTEAVGQGGEPLYLDCTGQWVVRYGDESYTPLQVTGRRTVQSEEPEPNSEPTPGQQQFMESLKEAAERMRV